MAGLDEAALTCDFAETYHVLDWRSLPARLAATLAMGLRPNSRIIMKLSGATMPLETILMAACLDHLKMIWWSKTEDGQKNRHRPKSTLAALRGTGDGEKTEGFSTPEAFRAWHAAMIGGNDDA